MGDVIPFTRPHKRAHADAAQAIGLAFHKASSLWAVEKSALPSGQVRAILWQRIVESAAGGVRDVDELCDDALCHLVRILDGVSVSAVRDA